jgi:hypothetical protein
MAFLPKPIEHDLFLSYAHEDKEWVSALQEKLTEQLKGRLACDCKVWQDENNLRTGQNIPKELDNAIRASAAFIAVLSRNYQNSKWCEWELAAFLDEVEREDGLNTSGHGRLLKVIKFPWLYNAHENFYPDYKDVPFFERDKTGQEREFRRNLGPFQKAVERLAYHVEKLFEAMLSGFVKVFVARAAEDAAEERESIINNIHAAGFALSPPPLGAILKGMDRKGLQKYIADANVSVHLLGASHDPALREQIDDALKVGKKTIFYLTLGHEAARGEQERLIKEIRNNDRKLPAGSWKLLENRSPAVRLEDLIGELKLLRPAANMAEQRTPRVYLLCDPTSPEDVGFAQVVQTQIQTELKFHVDLPQAAADSPKPCENHETLLQKCNGLLLYHDKPSPKWSSRNLADLLRAEERMDGQLKSRALLVAGTPLAIPEVTVIHRRDPFDLDQLKPFLDPLRDISAGRGEGAHAGD